MIEEITQFLIMYPEKDFTGPSYEDELRELATKMWEQVIKPKMDQDIIDAIAYGRT